MAFLSLSVAAEASCKLKNDSALSAKTRRIVSEKFNVTLGEDYDFYLSANYKTSGTEPGGYMERSTVKLTLKLLTKNEKEVFIVSKNAGSYERVNIRAVKALPNCLAGEI